MHQKYLAEFQEERTKCQNKIEHLQQFFCEKADCNAKEEVAKLKIRIDELGTKIRYHEDWLAKNGNVSRQPDWIECSPCGKTFNKNTDCWGVQDRVGFQPTCCYDCAENFKGKEGGRIIKSGSDEYFQSDPQQRGRMKRNGAGKLIIDNSGTTLITDNNNSGLEKENQELRQQLAEVQKQLAEVLEELKKLKSSLSGKGDEKLNQQIAYNEKLIKDSENISLSEVREQVNKSEALMKEFNVGISPTKNDKKVNGSLPYVIGGSVILVSAGIIGYCLMKKNRGKKVA